MVLRHQILICLAIYPGRSFSTLTEHIILLDLLHGASYNLSGSKENIKFTQNYAKHKDAHQSAHRRIPRQHLLFSAWRARFVPQTAIYPNAS